MSSHTPMHSRNSIGDELEAYENSWYMNWIIGYGNVLVV